MNKRYKVELLVSTDAPVEELNQHFASMLNSSHEVVNDEDRTWDLFVDAVSVQELP